MSDTPNTLKVDAMKGMEERLKAATGLGPQHAGLAYYLGDWDVEVQMLMPGMPVQTSRGRARGEWILEGRWLGQRFRGEMMGMPYESFAISGYDGYAQQHVTASVSSMDTALNVARGVAVDPEGRSRALYGTLNEYMTGQLQKPYKAVLRTEGPDRYVMEVWELGLGEAGTKVLEFRYERRAA